MDLNLDIYKTTITQRKLRATQFLIAAALPTEYGGRGRMT